MSFSEKATRVGGVTLGGVAISAVAAVCVLFVLFVLFV